LTPNITRPPPDDGKLGGRRVIYETATAAVMATVQLAGDPEYRGRRLGAGIGKVGDGKYRSALDHLCRRGFADRYKDE
jgi:hypothetical protein